MAKKQRGTAGPRGGKVAEPPAASTAEKQGLPVRGRPFPPGVSGNPAGRPAGARGKVSAQCFELLQLDAPAIVEQLIEMAIAGRPLALRLAVDRLMPLRAARDRRVEISIPRMLRAGDLVEASASIMDAACLGQITLSEARELMVLVEGQRKAIETADLVGRLEVLEAAGPLSPMGFAPAASEDPGLAARVRRLMPRDGGTK